MERVIERTPPDGAEKERLVFVVVMARFLSWRPNRCEDFNFGRRGDTPFDGFSGAPPETVSLQWMRENHSSIDHAVLRCNDATDSSEPRRDWPDERATAMLLPS